MNEIFNPIFLLIPAWLLIAWLFDAMIPSLPNKTERTKNEEDPSKNSHD